MTDQSKYDYVIIGTGMSALSVGALLAHAGQKVCLLEAHATPGGYAHTFSHEGYSFSAAVHYIWGCAPGQALYEFLRHLGLEKEITFEGFDPEGYDHAGLPDGKRVKLPYGFENLVDNLDAAYPGQRQNLEQFVGILRQLRDSMRHLPHKVHWWDIWTARFRFPLLIKYQHHTVQDLFNECGLSKEVQAVLCASAGDFGAPPAELSLFAYVALITGYNEGAYYPTKHFDFFVQRIADFIAEHDGCDIFYNTEVVGIDVDGSRVKSVRTADGDVFEGENTICNMDPQEASRMIGREKFPESYLPALSYQYSPSAFTLYIGTEGLDLRELGFGAFNIWHLEQWDMNQMWSQQMQGNFDNPWLFISTPTLRTSDPSAAPAGGHTMEIGTIASFAYFDELYKTDPKQCDRRVAEIREHFLDIVEQKYIPKLRDHVKVLLTGLPKDHIGFCHAPYGNCYGSHMTPENMGLGRLKADTPWKNFFWCNASSGYAGVHGTTLTGMDLYRKLSGETIFDARKKPSEEEAIAYAKTRYSV